MKIIGLCGGSGSGKGKVCEIFASLSVPSIDTDAVYREITSSHGDCLRALADEFGSEIITHEGSLNRRKLADIVFSGDNSESRLAMLNEISHKFILEETRRRLSVFKSIGAKAAIVDAPVLFESGFNRECDVIICVIADRERRIARIIARDNLSVSEAERRIAAQISDTQLVSKSDYVIHNNSDLSSLRGQAEGILHKILEK